MRKTSFWGLAVVMSVFAAFSLGSGSSEPTSTESVKIESDNSASGKSDGTSDSSSDKNEDNSKADSEGDVQYEITDTSFEYYTNSIGSIEYYGYVEITNTGSCNIYLKDATFDLEDDNEHLLQSDSFISSAPSVIKPGEKGYFYNGLGSNLIDDGVSLDNGINLVPQIKVMKATGEPTRFEVTDTELREGNYGSPKVTGRIVNDTTEDVGYLYINVIFYDANGKVLAITGTSVTDLTAGGKTSFECDAMFANENASMSSIADYKVIAEETYMQF